MNREIKFRGWDKEENDWLDLDEWQVSIDLDGIVLGRFSSEEWIDITQRIELMQYTELKDKNGKEIYEGDILGWVKDGETLGSEPHFVKMDVRFKDGAFYTHYEFSVNENYLPIVATWGEVIGNVWENGDLLK